VHSDLRDPADSLPTLVVEMSNGRVCLAATCNFKGLIFVPFDGRRSM